MEIFQTIWTALTTENEMLTNILLLPINFIESILNVLIFSTLLNIHIPKRKKVIYIILISIFLYLTGLFIPNPYKSFLNLIVIIISIHFFFKLPIIKSILCCIIPILFTGISESIIVNLSSVWFNFNLVNIVTIPIYRLIYALGILLIVFLLYLFIKYSKVQISLLENMSKKSKLIFFLNFIVALLAICTQFYITGFYSSIFPTYVVIFSNLSLLAYFILSLYSLTKTSQLEITSLNLEQEKENNKILQDIQDDLRGFRHDFANIICTIGGYVQMKDLDGLAKYYSQIQKDVIKMNNLGALNSTVINNPAIFVLISSKYSKALELGIEMNINVFLDLNTLNMKIYEFTRTLGILLDNAIQAAQECDEKIINLEIRKESNRNRQILLIENTYNNKDIDTEKIYEKNFSTKQGNSGLGLWEVRQILKRNTNLNLFTSKNNKFFRQQLEMYNI